MPPRPGSVALAVGGVVIEDIEFRKETVFPGHLVEEVADERADIVDVELVEVGLRQQRRRSGPPARMGVVRCRNRRHGACSLNSGRWISHAR
ncbi:hypothetical protein [Haladaptatus halobius]|uniref:hypothetical protein n=1 Tax=Haladaptatus halobius TaxID=2884875 RepID=UPI001D0A88D6|nr:hypothetical protein [Haladaptatus halobius]